MLLPISGLPLSQQACNHLKESTSISQQNVTVLDQEASASNPILFREYLEAEDEEKAMIEVRYRSLVPCAFSKPVDSRPICFFPSPGSAQVPQGLLSSHYQAPVARMASRSDHQAKDRPRRRHGGSSGGQLTKCMRLISIRSM
jgi:hypothetical protein